MYICGINMKIIPSTFKYVKPYWKYVSLNIVFNLFGIIFGLFSITLAIPFLGLLFGTEKPVAELAPFALSAGWIQQYFNYLISSIIAVSGRETALMWMCFTILTMFFFKNLCRYLAMYFLAPVRNGIIMDIRNALYSKILVLPLSYYSSQRKGDIMTRMTSDVQEIEWSVMGAIEMIFRDPPTIIVYLITLFVMSPQLTLISLLLLPLSALLIGRIGKSLKRTSSKGMQKTGDLLSIIEETLGGLRIIKAFNAEKTSTNRFEANNNELKRLMNRIYRKKDLASPISEVLGSAVIVTIMWLGGKAVLDGTGDLSPEIFMTYILVFSQILPPAKMISQAWYNIQKGKASSARVNEILDAPVSIVEHENAVDIGEFKNEVAFNNVQFTYGNGPTLIDINFTLKKGKSIALVGQSGSGKSTLVDLLPRFYDVTGGEILIDGLNLNQATLKSLRTQFGIVSQENILFNDTVFNNIAQAKPSATEEEVMRAAKIANAHDFILQMENGYTTMIGDRGHKLSGGQRQRISIARAVLKNPPILILDEATSALDTESERLVQDALNKLMQERTSLIIAHRLSTIQHVDEILVMFEGRIVERGTHKELLERDGQYRKLYNLQAFK
jgi:subfamily B ATP-binding cassette protein MsbA